MVQSSSHMSYFHNINFNIIHTSSLTYHTCYIFLRLSSKNFVCMFLCCPFVLHSRSVWTVSSHFEYLYNWSCGLDVTWQPVREDFTIHAWIITLPWGKSVGSETPLSELVYCVTIAFKMTERLDQQICIKFSFKLEHSSANTIQMIKKAFGYDSVSEAQIKLYYCCFKNWWESIESIPQSGRPSTSRKPEIVECVWTVINEGGAASWPCWQVFVCVCVCVRVFFFLYGLLSMFHYNCNTTCCLRCYFVFDFYHYNMNMFFL